MVNDQNKGRYLIRRHLHCHAVEMSYSRDFPCNPLKGGRATVHRVSKVEPVLCLNYHMKKREVVCFVLIQLVVGKEW